MKTLKKFDHPGWPLAIMILVTGIALVIGAIMVQSLASFPDIYNASSCTYFGKSWISGPWYCGISDNGTALCGTGGSCIPGLCHYPSLCNQTQNAIIRQNTTSWVEDT